MASLNNELAPICGIEGCKCEGSNEKINVICSTIDPQIKIFEAAFWNDSKTHHLYPYDSVTIQDNKINSLNKTFQTSNLTYLNLANNDISGIGEGVFKNLQNMKVLILSYNDLEIIHPDAFKVSEFYFCLSVYICLVVISMLYIFSDIFLNINMYFILADLKKKVVPNEARTNG